jgi:Ca2+-binding RTX toxin-like protein
MPNVVSTSALDSETFFNQRVSQENFGINFEARGISLLSGQPVESVLTNFSGTILRYPGGTPTENYFDPSDPDNPRPNGIFSESDTADFLPISEFIGVARSQNMSVAIVIPTYRFFDKENAGGDYLKPTARAEIYAFVTDLMAEKFGRAEISALEIGNEWFNSRMLYDSTTNPNGWTPAEFAAVQNAIVEVISSALDDAGSQSEVDIWIQSSQNGSRDLDGNGVTDNLEILQGLSDDSLANIDGIVDHFYQPTRGLTPFNVLREGLIAGDRIDRLAEAGFDIGIGGHLDVIASEWNIRAARNDGLTGDDANITGFERLPLVLGLFADMIAAGVDLGMIYTAQALGVDGGFGTLSTLGNASLTPTGLLFGLMEEALPGTQLSDPNDDGQWSYGDYVLQNDEGMDTAFTFRFQNANRIVLYYASGVMDDIDFTVSGLKGYLLAGAEVSVKLLTVADGVNPLQADAGGVVETRSFRDFFTVERMSDSAHFSLLPYQVVQIVISYGGQQTPPSDKRLLGGSDRDILAGAAWNDTLIGAGGNDVLNGAGGRDHLSGGAGNDILNGGTGDDFAYFMGMHAANINLRETAAQNTGYGLDRILSIEHISTGNGNDRIIGTLQNNRLSTGSGNDTLLGSGGQDSLNGGNGDDFLDGGAGSDVAMFLGTLAATVDLGLRNVQSTGYGNDRIINVENLLSGSGNDRLIGNSARNVLTSSGGNDTLTGGGNRDFLNSGAGNDHLSGGTSSDTLLGGAGNDHLIGGFGDDLIDGGDNIDRAYFSGSRAVTINLTRTLAQDTGHGVDTIRNIENVFSGRGNDWLVGNAKNNMLVSRDGNDTLEGNDGDDTLDGGNGIDVAAFTGDVAASVNLGLITGQNTGFGVDKLVNIENVMSGTGDDFLIGNRFDNWLRSSAGHDTLDGGGGNDRLESGAGNDQLSGGTGDDQIYGGFGDDGLTGGSGNDVLDGIDGIDRVYFAGTADVTVNLAVTTAQETGHGHDSILNVENVSSGSGNDRLIGSAVNNSMSAGVGDDTLSGGLGVDTLFGGDGDDVFVFSTILGVSDIDYIVDFQVDEDSIHLQKELFLGLTDGTLEATGFAVDFDHLSAATRLIYESTTGRLFFDADGTGGRSAGHFATLAANLALTHTDFFVF